MTTLTDIKGALSQIRTGADFPRYVQQLIALGVWSYETRLTDLSSTYQISDGSVIESPGMADALASANASDTEGLKRYLGVHQQGGSDFMTLRGQAATCGVVRWIVDTKKLSCSYYGADDEVILEEIIPQPTATG